MNMPDFAMNMEMAIVPISCTNATVIFATRIIETDEAIAAYGDGFALLISTN